MSVQTPNNPQNQGQGNSAMSDAMRSAGADRVAAGSPQGRAPQAGARRTGGRPAIMEINSIARRPVSRNLSSEQAIAFQKAINKSLDASVTGTARDDFQIIVADSSTAMLALSTLLACYSFQDKGITHVAVCPLVVEASGPRPQPRYINIGNTPVEIEQTAGDTVNPELWDKVVVLLQNTFGGKAEFHNAGAVVLPVELSPEDEKRIHEVTYHVTQALVAVIENDVTGGGEPISVAMVDGANVSASLDYNPPELENAVGLPVRTNLSITTRAALNNSNNQSLHEQQLDLTRADGYIDLIYVKPQQQVGPYNPYQQPVTQHYYPRFVLTNLDSQVDAVTLELQLLALASSTLASRQMAWSGVFLPRFNVMGPDLRDIGAIGYEVNLTPNPEALPDRIPTKSESFGRRELYQLIGAAVNDKVVYSLDVEETGPQAWINQTFIAAANGIATAYEAIIQAANNLTNGRFAQIWAPGTPIAQDDNNRIHLGYYVDGAGKRCDVRDLDYLAMLNLLGEKDLPKFHEWTETFENTQIPLEIRLQTRAQIIKALVPDVKIKGFARRITFTADFIAALEQAIQSAGLVIRPNNVQVIEGAAVQRGSFNADAFAVNNQVGAGLFSYAQSSPYGGYRGGLGSPYTGRFGAGFTG